MAPAGGVVVGSRFIPTCLANTSYYITTSWQESTRAVAARAAQKPLRVAVYLGLTTYYIPTLSS
ncbi:hypothetical protein Egran_00005 [Elaphomyces granulatus]|uniref:Uncharacterized protein n=1 Tax=Elaphomyces granulatus TaxID=519963 RepID=A0A232M7G9_9EURO|nr:hypothetical protein Egran_00005 [Elaphomyces granulatus]